MWIISALSLVIVMAGCLVGVFAPRHVYDDNLAQRLGMAGMFCFSWPRLAQILEQQALSTNVMPAYAQLAGHAGLALFVLGTAYKVWKHRSKKPPVETPPAPPILAEHWPKIHGGRK